MKTKLIIISVLVVVLAACLCVPVFAYADYEDIVSNQNSIVNFNQCIYDAYTHDVTITSSTEIGLINSSNSVYYISFDLNVNNSGTADVYINGYGIYNRSNGGSRSAIFNTSNSLTTIRLQNFINATSVTINHFIFVNLTQMFGSGSEPSLTECQELFVADYYPYNTGTSMSLSGINSYAQGVQDTLDSFVVTFNADIIGSLGYAYNYDGLNSEFNYNSQYSAYYFYNFFALPVGSIPSSSQIEIYTQFLNVSGGTLYYQVYYMLNNSLVLASSELIQYQTYNDYNSQYSAINVFSIPYVVDTLYFCVSTNSATYTDNNSMYALKSEMTFKTLDVSTLVTASFARGGEYYKTYYSDGHDGYNSIYNVGYTNGLNDDNPYTFGYLMSSVIESPLNAVLSIFNFDFLGVNFKNVITLILTLCIIVAIVRLFMGGN